MRSNGPTFRLHTIDHEPGYWWRMVSPNGRGIARSVTWFATPQAARDHIAFVAARVDDLVSALNVTPTHRWRWTLSHAGTVVVEEVGDSDRRVRCEQSCRRFLELAPLTAIDPTVSTFRRGLRRVAVDDLDR